MTGPSVCSKCSPSPFSVRMRRGCCSPNRPAVGHRPTRQSLAQEGSCNREWTLMTNSVPCQCWYGIMMPIWFDTVYSFVACDGQELERRGAYYDCITVVPKQVLRNIKIFRQDCNRKKHERTHTGEKPTSRTPWRGANTLPLWKSTTANTNLFRKLTAVLCTCTQHETEKKIFFCLNKQNSFLVGPGVR